MEYLCVEVVIHDDQSPPTHPSQKQTMGCTIDASYTCIYYKDTTRRPLLDNEITIWTWCPDKSISPHAHPPWPLCMLLIQQITHLTTHKVLCWGLSSPMHVLFRNCRSALFRASSLVASVLGFLLFRPLFSEGFLFYRLTYLCDLLAVIAVNAWRAWMLYIRRHFEFSETKFHISSEPFN